MNVEEKRQEWDECDKCGYLEGTNGACCMCHWGYPERSLNHDEPIKP